MLLGKFFLFIKKDWFLQKNELAIKKTLCYKLKELRMQLLLPWHTMQ